MTRTGRAILLAMAALTAQAETITFKSGAKFEGDVVAAKGTNAVIVRSDKDGKTYTITLSDLAEFDQRQIKHALGLPVIPASRDDLLASWRAEHNKAEAGKTLPEQPPDNPTDSGKITGAFGLKLGQRFDLRYAISTNKCSDDMTIRGDYTRVDLLHYNFRPRVPLTHFDWYTVGVTPLSNLVYSIEAVANGYESYSSACDERDKLLAALEQKYGKSVARHSDDILCYTIKQDTRQITLTFINHTNSEPALTLEYEDSSLHRQAKYEQVVLDAEDPKRKAERAKLKDQL